MKSSQHDESPEALRAKLLETQRALAIATKRIAELETKLEDRNLQRTVFQSLLNHEMRTPLNAILGMTELLREKYADTENAKQLQFFERIEASGRQLLTLLDNLYDLTLIKSSGLQLECSHVDFQTIFRYALRWIRPLLEKKTIQLRTDFALNMGTFYADESRLKQILLNLFEIIVRVCPEHSHVQVVAEPHEHEPSIRIRIWAQPPPHCEHWSPLPLKTLYKTQSITISQALSRELVVLHRGTFHSNIDDEFPGFELVFPVKGPKPSTASRELPKIRQVNNDRISVLLVEDNTMVIQTMSDFLELKGCEVLVSQRGDKALAMLRDMIPDIIVMDMRMPGMSGLELLKKIRENPMLPAIPIIILSGVIGDKERDEALEKGADMFLHKPVSMYKLLEHIHQLHYKFLHPN